MKATIEKIKSIPISDVIGKYIPITKAGVNYNALCPFHDEKTPSFFINNGKGIYKCFGCGESGDAIAFLIKHKTIGFIDAIKELCLEFKIEFKPSGQFNNDAYEIAHKEKESLCTLNHIAMLWFKEQLQSHTNAMQYLKEARALKAPVIENWDLGFAADVPDSIYSYLITKGYSDDLMSKSGLFNYTESGKVYDFFQNRIIIPIKNLQGKIIGFGGRLLPDCSDSGFPLTQSNEVTTTKKPKYLNTRETVIYSKGSELFGLYQAKEAIKKENLTYLVEGYFDVICPQQAGIQNIISGSGTTLSEEQVYLIKRFSNNVVMIYDKDKAGKQATAKNGELLIKAGCNVSVIKLQNKDIDEFIRSQTMA